MTRRDFLAAQAAAVATKKSDKHTLNPPISVFSKHLQWLGIPAMADAAKEMGFNAIDLTVRKGGHIEPQNALVELPKAVKEIRSRGLELSMVTTAIAGIETPHTENILRACAAANVRFFRWGGWKYRRDIPVESDIVRYRRTARRLADLASKYQVCGIYHTHSGIGEFGASIWDIHAVLKDIDHKAVAINYDIGHATIEGGFGGWINSARLCGPLMRGIAVKDFLWQKNAKGQWRPEWKLIGEGMVDFPAFVNLVASQGFDGPLQLHFEYPMGGAEHGDRTITWSRDQVLTAMRQDLEKLRSYFRA